MKNNNSILTIIVSTITMIIFCPLIWFSMRELILNHNVEESKEIIQTIKEDNISIPQIISEIKNDNLLQDKIFITRQLRVLGFVILLCAFVCLLIMRNNIREQQREKQLQELLDSVEDLSEDEFAKKWDAVFK